MSDKPKQPEYDTPRESPRAVAALDVEVEVEGQKRKVRLVSTDIGSGGIFLRTDHPAPLWKKIRLILNLPQGGAFEVAGEVVRCVSTEQSRATRRPAGMAVAFDEVSRSKRKELTSLVLDLCARRSRTRAPEEKKSQAPKPPKAPAAQPEPAGEPDDESDELLNEIDSLLDSVEEEIGEDSEDTLPELMTPDFQKKAKRKTGPTPGAGEPVAPRPEPDTAEAEPETEPEIAKGPPQEPRDSVEELKDFLANYGRSLKGDTYYDTLCVDKRAGPSEIEAAYKNLLGHLNPPGGTDSLPADLLRSLSVVLGKVRKAYAILSKPDRKRAYDFLIDNEVE